ncbi:MAG: HAD-IA family hydrolase [Acidimicrobiales bacterium]
MLRHLCTSSNLSCMISCVLFDFGGVVIESPFIAFEKFEVERGLPAGFLRTVNAINPNDNAWAKLERSDITIEEFDALFASESERLGYLVRGGEVLGLLFGAVRPRMRHVLDLLPRLGFRIVCLTNNVVTDDDMREDIADAMTCFERVYESSAMGSRKPEPEFYRAVLDDLGVEPAEAVFLDDLGINLKPAKAMGITTIKVTDEIQAIRELGDVVGVDLLGY